MKLLVYVYDNQIFVTEEQLKTYYKKYVEDNQYDEDDVEAYSINELQKQYDYSELLNIIIDEDMELINRVGWEYNDYEKEYLEEVYQNWLSNEVDQTEIIIPNELLKTKRD